MDQRRWMKTIWCLLDANKSEMLFQMNKFNEHSETILYFYWQHFIFYLAHFRCIALELGVFDNTNLIFVLDCLISTERVFHFEICLEWHSWKVGLTIFVPYVKKNVSAFVCTFRKREKYEMKSINKLNDHRMWWILNMLLNACKQSTNVFREKNTFYYSMHLNWTNQYSVI